jgi:hypothetical protein
VNRIELKDKYSKNLVELLDTYRGFDTQHSEVGRAVAFFKLLKEITKDGNVSVVIQKDYLYLTGGTL